MKEAKRYGAGENHSTEELKTQALAALTAFENKYPLVKVKECKERIK